MTQEEIETELKRLRERIDQQERHEQARRGNWFCNGLAARGLAVLFGACAAALMVAISAGWVGSSPFGQSTAFVLIIAAVIFNVMSASLRDPTPKM